MITFLLKIKEIIVAILIAFGVVFGVYRAGVNNAKKQQKIKGLENDRKYFRDAIAEKDKIAGLSRNELIRDILRKD
jgi:hypothetical protein